MSEDNEDRYESINLILRCREDGVSWFDHLFDYIAGTCQGTYDEETEEGLPCTCGLESMGGSAGTLEQCYKYQTQIARDIQPIDVAYGIIGLHAGIRDDHTLKILKWAEGEIEFEERWLSGDDEEENSSD